MSRSQSLLAAAVVSTVLIVLGCGPSTSPQQEGAAESASPATYDSLLADTLGADEYGMHPYVLALLKSGPNRDQDSARAAELQQAHMANIRRLGRQGTLVLAGPFMDDGDLRGIYIFDVSSVEEARALTETDPAIQAGRLEMELHPWYGSAALKKVNEIHARISTEQP